jgi:hypothetical protein
LLISTHIETAKQKARQSRFYSSLPPPKARPPVAGRVSLFLSLINDKKKKLWLHSPPPPRRRRRRRHWKVLLNLSCLYKQTTTTTSSTA